MLTKIYFGLWALVGLAAAIVFLMGNMSPLVLVVFGFISFGLVFMGMMGVLPILVSHPAQATPSKDAVREPAAAQTHAKARYSVAALFHHGVEVRRPKYP
jgi:tellurite resistance protein TehA-like permease